MTCEGYVIVKAECADIGHHIIRAFWSKAAKPCVLKHRDSSFPSAVVFSREPRKVAVRKGKRHYTRLLQRSGGTDRKEVVNLANSRREVWRRQHPTHPPTGHRKRFTHTVHK